MTPHDLQQIATLLGEQEQRLTKRFEQRFDQLDKKIDQAKDETIKGVADFIADNLMPLLEKQDRRLDHLERHTSHPPGAPVSV